jgi:hypothetical protein
MVTELGFHRSVYLANFATEDHRIDFRNQLAGLDYPQISATTPGGALGMLSGAGGKILTSFQLGLQLRTGFLGSYHDMTDMSVGHRGPPWLFSLSTLQYCKPKIKSYLPQRTPSPQRKSKNDVKNFLCALCVLE